MADLEFKDDDTIWAMFSGEGEKVNFVKKIDPKDRNVEYWMGDVEKMMQNSVRNVLLRSVEDYLVRPRNDWIINHPGQCVLNGSQVHWTADVEKAIKTNGVKGVEEYYEFLKAQLN
jgi:dynein heavy chain